MHADNLSSVMSASRLEEILCLDEQSMFCPSLYLINYEMHNQMNLKCSPQCNPNA